MDSQFNELTRSYHDNYLEYRVTSDPKYKTAYEGAQTGIQNILAGVKSEVDAKKKEIADFYTAGTEEKLNDMRAESREIKAGLLSQEDLLQAATIRQEPVLDTPSLKIQYISLAVLGVILIGLSML